MKHNGRPDIWFLMDPSVAGLAPAPTGQMNPFHLWPLQEDS